MPAACLKGYMIYLIPGQHIEVCDLTGAVVKSIKPPVQTNEIFYGGTASLILSSTSSVVLYDIQQQKTIAELNTPPVKYIMWSQDGSQVALLSKHSKYSVYLIRCRMEFHCCPYPQPSQLPTRLSPRVR
jgi:hypothetical protein